jgi:hypothetical protein
MSESLSVYEERGRSLARKNTSLAQSNETLQNKISVIMKQIESTEYRLIEIEKDAVCI